MFKKTLDLINNEFRPYAAFNAVSQVAQYHRIQCSPGFEAAANAVAKNLSDNNIAVEILRFPAKHGVTWWSQNSFPEWSCKDAELILLEGGVPERLCSFKEHKISLVQRSAPTSPCGLYTTIVYIEKGTEISSYDGVDVAGKIVFTQGDVSKVAKIAVDRFGAAGIAVDNMREIPGIRDRYTLPDGRQYQSFWPAKAYEHKAFGFMLTPRQGDALRSAFAKGKTELKVFAKVDSRFFDGHMEVVQATIPGKTDGTGEEVAAIAHLCHPQPSANDNASGCGALAEAAAALKRLIDSGSLPKPKRTIRFLWLPEMSGSYAYLASREKDLPKFAAAINLDMVGQNQALCGSTFIVEQPVAALPGFGGELAASLLKLLTRQLDNLGGSHSYSTFRWTISPYSGGSDHYVWGDPSVGVTCPMIIQWPDKYYHTSEDTMDKVDPDMLRVSGVLAAAYVYLAATATPAQAAFLAKEMAIGLAEEIENALAMIEKTQAKEKIDFHNPKHLSKAKGNIKGRIDFLCDRKAENIKSLPRLAGKTSDILDKAIASALSVVENTRKYLTQEHLKKLAYLAGFKSEADLPEEWVETDVDVLKRAKTIVPIRCFRGPFSNMGREVTVEYEAALESFRKKYKKVSVPSTLIEYWADGKRSLLEMTYLVKNESGFYNLQALLEYYDLMVLRGVFQTADSLKGEI